MSDISRASLIHHLRSKVNSGKMNLERDGHVLGRLKRVEMTKYSIEQDRCLNGEVTRLTPDQQDICGKFPTSGRPVTVRPVVKPVL